MDEIIRAYVPEDLDGCRQLWAELTQRHHDLYDDPAIGGSDPGRYFDTTYLTTDGLQGPWVVELDGQLIDLSGLVVHGNHGEIEPAVVAEGQRSRGVGTALIAHVVEEARSRGVQLLTVRPVARNIEAIEFFVREGFATLGQIDLTRDLSGSYSERWKSRVQLHGQALKY